LSTSDSMPSGVSLNPRYCRLFAPNSHFDNLALSSHFSILRTTD
jgi:hypothetical protein